MKVLKGKMKGGLRIYSLVKLLIEYRADLKDLVL
nr:MAG TPA: hypothetical protein [Bacteriophage sp.]